MESPHRFSCCLYPFAQLAAVFAFGILIGEYAKPHFHLLVILCLTSSVGSFISLRKNRFVWTQAFLLLAVGVSGAIQIELTHRTTIEQGTLREFLQRNSNEGDRPIVLTGVVAESDFTRAGTYLVLSVETIERAAAKRQVRGAVSLFVAEAKRDPRLEYGTKVRVRTVLDFIDQYQNPGVSTLTEFLDRKDYDAKGMVKGLSAIELVGTSTTYSPLRWLSQLRHQTQERIDSLFAPETAGVLDAAFLGNRYNLSHSTAERFRAAGTFHVLVISGLHISFLGGIVLALVKLLTRKRLLQFFVSTLVVWSYSVAVGAGPSVMRAALMFTFVTCATVVFRPATSLNGVSAAALSLLIWKPKDLFDPALQLTLLSVVAIVAIAWPLLQKIQAIGRWRPTRNSPYPPSCSRTLRALAEILFWDEAGWLRDVERLPHKYRLFKSRVAPLLGRIGLQWGLRQAFAAVVISLGVQLMLLPLLIIHFHRVSLSALVLNIVVGLMLTLLAAVALAALALALVSRPLAIPLVVCADGINWLMTHGVDPFARFGLASFRVPEYSGVFRAAYFVYFLPLCFLIVAVHYWNPFTRSKPSAVHVSSVRYAGILQLILVLILTLHPNSAPAGDGRLHVNFLDVGQGDSALLTMPDGTTILIDGGGRPVFAATSRDQIEEGQPFERDARGIGEAVVSEYLWSRGFGSIDYLIATHADADHIDGLNDVVRNFNVRSALVGRTPMQDPEFAEFAESLKLTGTPVTVIQTGDRISLGAVELEVLWPSDTSDADAPSANNDSVVVKVKIGHRVLLLTGDIEKAAESAILASNSDLRADVVKVPHHGSRTSSTEPFVSATRPLLAIISVGRKSMFGHPHPDVVQRWLQNGAEVMTTGRCGTITVITDGDLISIEPYLRNCDVKATAER